MMGAPGSAYDNEIEDATVKRCHCCRTAMTYRRAPAAVAKPKNS